MACFEELLAAIGEYIKADRAVQTESTAVCYDWDCGIANEMGGAFADATHREGLNRARSALESALNEYIDERVRAAAEKVLVPRGCQRK